MIQRMLLIHVLLKRHPHGNLILWQSIRHCDCKHHTKKTTLTWSKIFDAILKIDFTPRTAEILLSEGKICEEFLEHIQIWPRKHLCNFLHEVISTITWCELMSINRQLLIFPQLTIPFFTTRYFPFVLEFSYGKSYSIDSSIMLHFARLRAPTSTTRHNINVPYLCPTVNHIYKGMYLEEGQHNNKKVIWK